MTVQPTGPGLMLLIVMSVCLVLTTIVVALRVWARITIRALGVDDWLMILGWACLTFVFICDFIFIAHGVGAHADRISPSDKMIATKWFLFAGIGYAISTAPIKASICVLLLRITAGTRSLYTYILFGNMFLACAASFIRVVAYTSRCRPFKAAWDPDAGTCANVKILTDTSYFFGAVCILTDVVCAVLPSVVIWSMRLERRVKWYLGIILALGFLASIATIIRMKYLTYYADPHDTLYNLVPIALWSEIEGTLGILAGSLATLRPLLRYLPHPFSMKFHGHSPPQALDVCLGNFNLNTPSVSLPAAETPDRTRVVSKRGSRREISCLGHGLRGNGKGDEEGETDSVRRILGEREDSVGKETAFAVGREREREGKDRDWGDWGRAGDA